MYKSKMRKLGVLQSFRGIVKYSHLKIYYKNEKRVFIRSYFLLYAYKSTSKGLYSIKT